MRKSRSLSLYLGILSSCLVVSLIFSGCGLFKSKDQKAADKAKEAFRQGTETKVAGNTTGNPKWKKDIDKALTDSRNKVANNTTGTNPSRPPGRNQSTNVKLDLSRAKSTTYHSVATGGNHIALTFDDGPHRTNTPRLLDMLKQRNIKATFFVVATNAKRYPDIMRRIVAEGHEIANHTVTHGNLSKMSNARIKREMDGCRDAIIAACGVNPRVMRAPYGALTSSQKIYIKDTWGYPNIHWSVDPEDWKKPGPSVVANRIISRTRAGGIVLVHDIHASSIVAMPQALDGLLAKNFRFVTTSQLISLGNRTASAEPKPAGSESEVTAAAADG
ncbi:MAG: peptidoglycan/xylan/chitin deacetylase (PgdA/CDA1 family), partial [Verrucomicrobiales bacterium]